MLKRDTWYILLSYVRSLARLYIVDLMCACLRIFLCFFSRFMLFFVKHNYLSSFDVSKQKVIAYLGPNLSCLCLALAKISEGLPCAKQAGLHELITQADFFPLSAIVSKLKFVAPACLHFDK